MPFTRIIPPMPLGVYFRMKLLEKSFVFTLPRSTLFLTRCKRQSSYFSLPCGSIISARFSSSAADSPNVSQTSGNSTNMDRSLEGRYASALFTVAISKSQLDGVYRDLESLNESLSSPKLRSLMLTTPSMIPERSVHEFLDIFQSKFAWNNTSINFLDMLLVNKRMNVFPEIFSSFQKLYRSHNKQKFCRISTSSDLSPSERKEVIDALQKRVGKAFKLIVEFVTSPTIMGGFMVAIDDQVFDFTVSTRLERLQAQLLEPLSL
ncbi:ATP synthase F1, delta subunit protein [Cardiosporidium cionae]|uniref:ATP synthase F1, delta subunit protein n=1 Tax=Cardiosporidium cionae TaxID=476202 RepID=A0ABQ7J4J0_9APIC|nr:ATP synthase F1, delta subunit protein [Cardiosporidium cionae]|eukprot:KAF8818138.1 ATP synthase F1, delta subunit protein [Cardiosporidium cionae]